MKPEDLRNINQTPNPVIPPQPDLSVAENGAINPVQPQAAASNQPNTQDSPVISGENQLESLTPIETASFPAASPITPDLAQNIYPDMTNPGQPRPLADQTITVDNTTTKKSKKGLVIGLIAAGALVLMGGGSAAAYTFWYSNPDKVIADAMVNTINAKTSIYAGTIKVDNDDMKVSVDITSKQADVKNDLSAKLSVTMGEKTYSASGNAIVDGTGDVYFKVNVESLVSDAKSYIGSVTTDANFNKSVSKAIDDFAAKVNDKWIKITSSDLAGFDKSYSKSKDCINETVKKYKDDKAAIAEITNLYGKQPFVVADKELGQKGGSLGYQIKTDETKFKAFTTGLKDTQIYKSINSCDSSYSVDDLSKSMTSEAASSDKAKVELWVDAWSHYATKMTVAGESSGTKVSAEVLPKYNQTVNISTPSSSITLTQLTKYYEELVNSVYGASSN